MHTLNDDATALLDLFQRELLALVQRDEFQAMPHIVITGLLGVAGAMMKRGLQAEASSLPACLEQIAYLRTYILPAAGVEEPTAPTRH